MQKNEKEEIKKFLDKLKKDQQEKLYKGENTRTGKKVTMDPNSKENTYKGR